MHKFTYEIEYKQDYSVVHQTLTAEIMAHEWHEAMRLIQWHVMPTLDGHIISVRLLKED